jgi:hypothetical protein
MVSLAHVAVCEDLADWETGQHSPASFDVRTVGFTAAPIMRMGAAWFRLHARSDVSAYAELMSA